MAIQFTDVHEPLSHLARKPDRADSDDHVVLATSDATERLVDAIRRYVDGKTAGRAILISGHRGAGKSTLVYDSVRKCRRASEVGKRTRPILISLNGPMLLDPAITIPAGTPPPTDGKHPIVTQWALANDPKAEARTFLSHVAMAIYKALSRELTERLRKSPTDHPSDELIASMQLELDDVPTEARLGAFWHRLRGLPNGLFDLGQSLRDQGMRELVALASAARAYREVVYDLHVSLNSKATNDRTTNATNAPSGNGDPGFTKALLGLATGGAVGVGAHAGLEVPSMWAALAAVASGAITTFGLTHTFTDSSQYTRSVSETMDRDPDKEASLGRMLPDLIDRLRDAGLVPVFVVDELDKLDVDDLRLRFGRLRARVKLLITDCAFFCFVVGRNYLESLKAESLLNDYHPGYTFFSDALLIIFSPDDLHRYLKQRMRWEEPDEKAVDVLRYVLLHRSRLHPIDLRREIERATDRDRKVRMTATDILNRPRHGLDVHMQLAVECQLRDKSLRERCDRDPHFVGFAYDALYYASREWERGAATLDASEEAIRKYLEVWIPLVRIDAAATAKGAKDPAKFMDPITDRDRDLLVFHAQRVVEHLADPERLKAALDKSVPGHVVAVVPRDPLLSPMGGDRYRWTSDFTGLPLIDQIATELTPEHQAQLNVDIALVGAFLKLFEMDAA